jgi:hypothetical protein
VVDGALDLPEMRWKGLKRKFSGNVEGGEKALWREEAVAQGKLSR